MELESAGASNKEAEELSLLSQNISNLLTVERSASIKNRFLDSLPQEEHTQQSFAKKWLVIPMFAVLLLISVGSVAYAQKSLPGQPLYPVKILSEDIVVAVVPSFKGEILQRRSEEIKTLSQQNNSQNSVNLQKTINRYEKTLQEDGGINAASIEESRRNLEAASKGATLENKEAIENVIRQTDNTAGQDIKKETNHEGNDESSPVQEELQNKDSIQNSLDR
jgi:hypothetical protein